MGVPRGGGGAPWTVEEEHGSLGDWGEGWRKVADGGCWRNGGPGGGGGIGIPGRWR
jgi:hypothetical protein